MRILFSKIVQDKRLSFYMRMELSNYHILVNKIYLSLLEVIMYNKSFTYYGNSA